MKRLLAIGVFATLVAGASAQTPDPLPIVQELLMTDVLPVRYGDVAFGDYDADNRLDMLLTGARGGPSNPNPNTTLYRCLGDTTLIVFIDSVATEVDAVHMVPLTPSGIGVNIGLPDLWQSTAEWADYDNDGDLDIAMMGIARNEEIQTVVFRQNSSNVNNRRFVTGFSVPTPLYGGDLTWGDVDNDGDLDLAICGVQENGEPRTVIYANGLREGQGFYEISHGLPDLGHCSLDLADFDIDGDLDFLVTGTQVDGTTHTGVYTGNGRGSFSQFNQQFEDFLFSNAAWGDYDADGYTDFMVTGAQINPLLLRGYVELYRFDTTETDFFDNMTDRIFGAFEGDPVTGRYAGDLAWGDIDGDGFHDFIIGGAETPQSLKATTIYVGENGQYFERSEADEYLGGFRGGVTMVDYDLDRDLDLVVFGEIPGVPEAGPRVRILRNNLIFGKLAPVPPEAISSSVSGRTVTLSWTPGYDRQTRPSGLTYNVRIGTSPGTADVIAPMADLETGRRHVTRRAFSTALMREIRNLPPGTYYWAVQALDHTFYGSVWTEEARFTIE